MEAPFICFWILQYLYIATASTSSPWMVTHSSANRGQRCLTSVFLRELVFPTWYSRSVKLKLYSTAIAKQSYSTALPRQKFNVPGPGVCIHGLPLWMIQFLYFFSLQRGCVSSSFLSQLSEYYKYSDPGQQIFSEYSLYTPLRPSQPKVTSFGYALYIT